MPRAVLVRGAEVRCGTCGGHLGDLFLDGKLFQVRSSPPSVGESSRAHWLDQERGRDRVAYFVERACIRKRMPSDATPSPVLALVPPRNSLSSSTHRVPPQGTPAARSGKRYCIDGAALVFEPADGAPLVIGEERRAPGTSPQGELPSWLQPPGVKVL